MHPSWRYTVNTHHQTQYTRTHTDTYARTQCKGHLITVSQCWRNLTSWTSLHFRETRNSLLSANGSVDTAWSLWTCTVHKPVTVHATPQHCTHCLTPTVTMLHCMDIQRLLQTNSSVCSVVATSTPVMEMLQSPLDLSEPTGWCMCLCTIPDRNTTTGNQTEEPS